VGEVWEQSRKQSQRQGYEIQPLLAERGSPVKSDGVTREEGIWFSLKEFKFISG
jgi:hypothetical protein